jgi:NADH:ubiquinone oxidoreductase subunit K
MNFQFIIYFSLLVFLMGIFGIFYSRDIISVFISFQFILISAVINFLSFSQFLYQSSLWDEIFIVFGIASMYFLMFCIISYFYLKLDLLDRKALDRDFFMFKVERHDWWGEGEM